LISQVQEDLIEEKGYTEAQAANAVYSGGLRIYSTQDTEIQEIMEEEFENEENYPDYIRFGLDWALTVDHEDGSRENYDQETLRNYFRERDAGFSGIFESQEEAQRYVDEYKAAIVGAEDTII